MKNPRNRKLSAALSIFVLVGIAMIDPRAQESATVSGKVETPDGETKEGLKVRAIPKFFGVRAKTRRLTGRDYNHTTHVYSYRIDHLQPGAYEFVLCDGLDYRPIVQAANVQPGQDIKITFSLQDQPKGDGRNAGELREEDRPAGEGVPVFLKHVRSGCVVAEQLTNKKGQYEFLQLPGEDYVVSTYEPDWEP